MVQVLCEDSSIENFLIGFFYLSSTGRLAYKETYFLSAKNSVHWSLSRGAIQP